MARLQSQLKVSPSTLGTYLTDVYSVVKVLGKKSLYYVLAEF